MGIRKGWALCGVREESCFISHAVLSHPFLELQTGTLHSLLFSPSWPAIGFHSEKPSPSLHPATPYFCIFSFANFFFFLPCPVTISLVDFHKGDFWYPIVHTAFLQIPEAGARNMLTRPWSYSFFSSSSPSWLPLQGYYFWFCTCRWNGRRRVSLWIHCPPSAPPLRLLLFPRWSKSGLVSWGMLSYHGHGASLGKHRPGQQGFNQVLIILSSMTD